MTEFVYVLSDGVGPLKIGFSNAPKKRAQAEAWKAEGRLQVVAAYPREAHARAVEFVAHWLLRHAKVRQEWFAVTVAEARAAVEEAIRRVDARDWSGMPRKRIPKPLRPPPRPPFEPNPAREAEWRRIMAEADAWAQAHPEEFEAMCRRWRPT